MRVSTFGMLIAGIVGQAAAYNCSVASIQSLLTNLTELQTVVYHPQNVTAVLITNYNAIPDSGGPNWAPAYNQSFCNVTFTLSHTNLDDLVYLQYWLPIASSFQNRYLTLGGGGWSVSGAGMLPAGIPYGAVSGATDGGFGGFSSSLTTELLSPVNGTIVWSRLESFAYQAIHELTVTGKELTELYYGISNSTLRSYYSGCSEGGREGQMSVQRFPNDFDGVITGAPAFYFPIMQLGQGWPMVAMQQYNHWPSPCAFIKVLNDTITACDSLDGLTDGVVSRSDLCQYNALSSVNSTYSGCSTMSPSEPTNGTVSELDAQVINAIYNDGPIDSDGQRIFWAYRNATRLTVEAPTVWNETSGSYVAGNNFFFGTYYQNLVLKNQYLNTVDYSKISVDDIFALMREGILDYGSWTETTLPDLRPFVKNGGKLIHYHGEADTNLFPEASAHYHEKVRHAMFPDSNNYTEINEFYRFFIVPGMAHCAINPYQPNGPFPQYGINQLIDWVEQGIAPAYLNGTTSSGSSTQDKICLWPKRPQWDNSSATFSCVNETVQFIKPLTAWESDY